jgi:hypothetical protein
MLNRFALAIVGNERGGMRLQLGDCHCGSEYHLLQPRAGFEAPLA